MADEDTVLEAPDFLNMSDEDLAKFDPSTLTSTAEVVTEVVDAPVVETVAEDEDDTDPEETSGVEETGATGDDDEGEAGIDGAGGADATKPEGKEVAPVVATPPAEVIKPAEPVVASGVNYQAEYERLLKPFKANGKDISVTGVDDAISLMQMGANYTKKMAGLKPNLQLLRLLEDNGLLNEEKIGYLIDLDKKSPEAISKLIKDSGHDPLDLDAQKASEYKPKTYTVDPRADELNTVLDELQSTPTYNQTLDIVSNKWDGPSKQVIAESPQLLKVINAHVSSGIYNTIAAEVERERMFGRLSGLSDLEAYRQIGDALNAKGAFATGTPPAQPAAPVVIVTPKPKVEDDKLRDKRRAASSTKPAGTSVAKDFNPLSMSDEEFSKQVKPNFL